MKGDKRKKIRIASELFASLPPHDRLRAPRIAIPPPAPPRPCGLWLSGGVRGVVFYSLEWGASAVCTFLRSRPELWEKGQFVKIPFALDVLPLDIDRNHKRAGDFSQVIKFQRMCVSRTGAGRGGGGEGRGGGGRGVAFYGRECGAGASSALSLSP